MLNIERGRKGTEARDAKGMKRTLPASNFKGMCGADLLLFVPYVGYVSDGGSVTRVTDHRVVNLDTLENVELPLKNVSII